MKVTRILSVVVAGVVVWAGGCANRPTPTPTAMPPSAETLQEIRASYRQAFPNARVGVVTAVLPGSDYALVGEIDVAGLVEGATVSFLDAGQTPIAHGDVVKIEPTGLTVQFTAGVRRPVAGDAAVKF